MNRSRALFLALMASVPLSALADDCIRYTRNELERALVLIESSANPYAIGVVGGHLQRQPRSKEEAVATALSLKAQGFNYSMGCRQVNQANLAKYGLDYETVFEPSENSKVGTAIYSECWERAVPIFGRGEAAKRAALSCYYSGNFTRGQRKEGDQSYVEKVLAKVAPGERHEQTLAIPVIPTRTGLIKPGIRKAEASTGRANGAMQFQGGPDDWDVFNEF